MDAREYTLMAQVEDTHWWFSARRKILTSMLKRFAIPDNADILEVGCGTGGNLEMLAAFGNVRAVEMDSGAASMARGKNIAKEIISARLPQETPFADKKFDLIVMFDVLEHIDEDTETLKVLRGLLKEKGQVFVTVPAFQFLWSAHDVALHHKRRYTAQQLQQVFAAAGYRVHYLTYFNFFLFPLIAGVRLVQKAFGKEGGSDVAMPSRWVNKILETIFASERFLVGTMRLPFGVSLMLTATKS